MSIKIKNIYLENFKGISGKKVINFKENITLFIGPNGFGKTTIFDILEICFTDIIHRVKMTKPNNKNNNIPIDTKRFYQNTLNKQVILKLLLEKTNDSGEKEYLTIIKFDEGIGNCTYSDLKFKTYVFNNDYFKNDIDFSKKTDSKSNLKIKNFLELKNGQDMKKLYPLFNYLEQEESNFYLKQSEYDREKNLDFLFNTEKEARQKNNIKIVQKSLKTKSETINFELRNLNIKKEELISKLIEQKKLIKLDFKDIDYKKIIINSSFDFDNILPFQDISRDKLSDVKNNYLSKSNELMTFIKNFSPENYEKKKKYLRLNKLYENDEFLKYYLLQQYLGVSNLTKIKNFQNLVIDNDKLEYYILKLMIPKIDDYLIINQNLKLIKTYKKEIEYEKKLVKLKILIMTFNPKFIDKYESYMTIRKNIKKFANDIELVLSETLRLRNDMKENIKNFDFKNQDGLCPFCGENYENYENLIFKFEEREKSLKNNLNSQVDTLENIDKSIKLDLIIPILRDIENYEQTNSEIDKNLLTKLDSYKNFQYSFVEFEKFNHTIKELVWTELKSLENLNLDIEQLRNIIKNNLLIDNEIYSLLLNLEFNSFEKELKEIKYFSLNGILSEFILDYSNSSKLTMSQITKDFNKLKNIFDELKSEYKYEQSSSEDKNDFYDLYFKNDMNNFKNLTEKDILNKIKYINLKFNEICNDEIIFFDKSLVNLNNNEKKLKNCRESIITHQNKFNDLYNLYDKNIKNFKEKMIEKIKIPFYIYSGKILQNYQQGMGLFIESKPLKENSDKIAIRFLTDTKSDHDALHHLSSGQLSVLSLAFRLSINKKYNLKNTNFLLIDDPIKDMDSLNIHSFIELIRYNFLNDYQIIMSTHDDSNAFYMKYKFENIKKDSVNLINVQNEFFNH